MRRKAIIIMPDAKPLPASICVVAVNDPKWQMLPAQLLRLGSYVSTSWDTARMQGWPSNWILSAE